MTWKQFKDQVEAGGVTDEMELWYIDASFDGTLSVSPQNMEAVKEDKRTSPGWIGFSVTN